MRVNWPGGVGPPSPRRVTGTSAAGGAFTLATPLRDPAEARGAGMAGAASALGAMLAVQGVEESGERRRRAVRRGHTLLDRLDELRLGLLDGSVSAASLERLRMGLPRGHPPDEPALCAVLIGIELRAAVEIAKLERGHMPDGA